jgi:hypothetical protein
MIAPSTWPPFLSPPWLAAYAVGVSAWLAVYGLGGGILVVIVAGVGCSALARLGWWLHTWSDREARRTLRRWRGGDAQRGGDEP